VALDDVRGVVEGRLAVLEDALDGLSERLEALARDGASTTTSLLQGLDATVRRLPAVLAARDEQQRAELLALVRSDREQAARDHEAAQELARTVRSTLEALTSALADEDGTVRRLPAVLAARDEVQHAELLEALRADREEAARERVATQQLALGVQGTVDALSSALVEEDARSGRQRAALEAGLDRVRTQVTTELAASGATSRPSWRPRPPPRRRPSRTAWRRSRRRPGAPTRRCRSCAATC
jgi:hypothetical protein